MTEPKPSFSRLCVTALALTFALVSGAAMAADSTEISERLFRVVLPGQWTDVTQETDEAVWEYQSENGTERLTVSVFLATTELAAEELPAMFETFVEIRRQAEIEEGGEDVLLTDTARRDVPGAILGAYNGADGKRTFSTRRS